MENISCSINNSKNINKKSNFQDIKYSKKIWIIIILLRIMKIKFMRILEKKSHAKIKNSRKKMLIFHMEKMIINDKLSKNLSWKTSHTQFKKIYKKADIGKIKWNNLLITTQILKFPLFYGIHSS